MKMLAPVGVEMIRALALRDGTEHLDIASGTGEPGLSIADKVPRGRVVLTDLSGGMLAAANANANARGLTNVEIRECSADDLPFDDASFDTITCRFGFMFFPDIAGTVAELMRVLRPGRRTSAAVWAEPPQNPWATIPLAAISAEVALPAPPPVRPGCFAVPRPERSPGCFTTRGCTMSPRPMCTASSSPRARKNTGSTAPRFSRRLSRDSTPQTARHVIASRPPCSASSEGLSATASYGCHCTPGASSAPNDRAPRHYDRAAGISTSRRRYRPRPGRPGQVPHSAQPGHNVNAAAEHRMNLVVRHLKTIGYRASGLISDQQLVKAVRTETRAHNYDEVIVATGRQGGSWLARSLHLDPVHQLLRHCGQRLVILAAGTGTKPRQ